MDRKDLRSADRNKPGVRKAQGDRLRQLRIAAGFKNATKAADHLNIAGPTYLAHENGTRQIRDDMAATYAEAFGSSPEWILFATGTMKVDRPAVSPHSDISEDKLVAEVASVLNKLERASKTLSPATKAMILSGFDAVKKLLSKE